MTARHNCSPRFVSMRPLSSDISEKFVGYFNRWFARDEVSCPYRGKDR